MEYLFFLGGVFVGSIITQIIIHWRAGSGYFYIDPVFDAEEPDTYKVNVALTRDQQLLKKKTIILKRDTSHE